MFDVRLETYNAMSTRDRERPGIPPMPQETLTLTQINTNTKALNLRYTLNAKFIIAVNSSTCRTIPKSVILSKGRMAPAQMYLQFNRFLELTYSK